MRNGALSQNTCPSMHTMTQQTVLNTLLVGESLMAEALPDELLSLATIVGTPDDDQLVGTPNDDQIRGQTGDDAIRGGNGNDFLTGDRGADRLRGNAGEDGLIGGPGDDVLFGGSGKDALDGSTGDDRVVGGAGNDLIKGGRGNDRLLGGPGNDQLVGNGGRDQLVGGAGNDQLYDTIGSNNYIGGGGRDVFVLAEGDSRATIRDFVQGTDQIGLLTSLFLGGPTFDDLTLFQRRRDTVITLDNERLGRLKGVTASNLSADDFIAVELLIFEVTPDGPIFAVE